MTRRENSPVRGVSFASKLMSEHCEVLEDQARLWLRFYYCCCDVVIEQLYESRAIVFFGTGYSGVQVLYVFTE